MSEYIELLRHPFWQRKRTEILQRDDFRCTKCTDQFTNLQVHHTYYKYGLMPWEYPNESLVTVCELCHKKEEFVKWLFKLATLRLLGQGFSLHDTEEIKKSVRDRLLKNMHFESASRYMDDIKTLVAL